MKTSRCWSLCLLLGLLVWQPLQAATVLEAGSDPELVENLLRQTEKGREFVSIDDMRFKVEYLQRAQQKLGNKQTHAGSPTGTTKWPTGVVPYVFASNTTATMRSQFLAAANEWSLVAGVSFVARTSEANYVFVEDSDGNNSYVGMQGGSQTINIYNWTYRFIICHEIAHALGMCHEQSRSDRDTYVTILTDNIQPGLEYNFSKQATLNPTTYDFGSIMHYGPTAFSINGQLLTIKAKDAYASQATNMGQRDGLSALDKQGMVALYGAPGQANLTFNLPQGWSDKVVLAVSAGTTTDHTVLASDTLYVDFGVTNNGEIRSTLTSAQVYLDNAVVKTVSLSALDPGDSLVITDLNLGALPAGSHNVRVKLDSSSSVTESDETDNEYARTFTVGPPGTPNLTAGVLSGWSDQLVIASSTNAIVDAPALYTTDSIFLNIPITNAGTATAAGFNVQILIDNTVFQTRVINTLSAGAFSLISNLSLGSLSSGNHTIRVKIDAAGAIAESNETDNEFTKTITIITRPNLAVYKPATWSDKIVVTKGINTNTDELIHPGDSVFVDVAVINSGAGPTTTGYVAEVYLDNVLKATLNGSSVLNPAAIDSWQDLSLGALAAGLHSIKFKVDTTNAISESGELDNEFTKVINVILAPVITTQPIGTIIGAGQSVTLNVEATGSDLTYQWFQGNSGSTALGVVANGPTFKTPALSTTVSYWARVSNAGGAEDSASATITVGAAASAAATHSGPAAYIPGTSIQIATTFTYTGILRALSWQPQLPPGWTITGATGPGNPELLPSGVVNWSATSLPASPVTMTYTVSVPADAMSEQGVRGLVSYRLNGDAAQQLQANSNPLIISDTPRTALTLEAQPASGGTITAAPLPDSAGRYTPGTVVTLTFVPKARYRFLSWSGDAAGTTASVQVTMDQDRSVIASFQELSSLARNLPESYLPGAPAPVSVTTTPGGGVGQHSVEELLPTGWSASSISAGGAYSSATGKITWGPFSDHAPRTLTYLATAPSSASGPAIFAGSGSFDGENVATIGLSSLAQGEPFDPSIRAGTYYGLIQNPAGKAPVPQLNGAITLKMAKSGTFSAQVVVGGQKATFKGRFDGTTGLAPSVHVASKSFPAADISLQIDGHDENGAVTGLVTTGGVSNGILARRATFNARNPDPHAGQYTLIMQPPAGAAAGATPPGSSVASLTVGKDGKTKMKGVLADGSKFSGGSGVSADGSWPLFSLLPKGAGYVGGWVSFDWSPRVSDGAGRVTWVKTAGTSTAYYGQGFTKEEDALVSKYVHARNQAPLAVRAGSNNARLSVAGGDLPAAPAARTITLNPNGSVYEGSGERFKMKVNVASGLFSGTLPDPNSGQPHEFQGVLFQIQGIGLGWFAAQAATGSIKVEALP